MMRLASPQEIVDGCFFCNVTRDLTLASRLLVEARRSIVAGKPADAFGRVSTAGVLRDAAMEQILGAVRALGYDQAAGRTRPRRRRRMS